MGNAEWGQVAPAAWWLSGPSCTKRRALRTLGRAPRGSTYNATESVSACRRGTRVGGVRQSVWARSSGPPCSDKTPQPRVQECARPLRVTGPEPPPGFAPYRQERDRSSHGGRTHGSGCWADAPHHSRSGPDVLHLKLELKEWTVEASLAKQPSMLAGACLFSIALVSGCQPLPPISQNPPPAQQSVREWLQFLDHSSGTAQWVTDNGVGNNSYWVLPLTDGPRIQFRSPVPSNMRMEIDGTPVQNVSANPQQRASLEGTAWTIMRSRPAPITIQAPAGPVS